MRLRPTKKKKKMLKRETIGEIAESGEGSADPKIKNSLSLDKAKTEIMKEIAESIGKIVTEKEEQKEGKQTDGSLKAKVENKSINKSIKTIHDLAKKSAMP